MKLLLFLAPLGLGVVTAAPGKEHGFIESSKDQGGIKVPGNSPFSYCKNSPSSDSFKINTLSMEPTKKTYEKNKNITIVANADSDQEITKGARMNIEIHWGSIKNEKNLDICKFVDCPTHHVEFEKSLKIPKNAPDGTYSLKVKMEGPDGSGDGGRGREQLLQCMMGQIKID